MKAAAQRKWITTIHVAKNKLSLDDDAYRAILSGSAGVSSASEIKTWEQYQSVMAAFRGLGFKLQKASDIEPQNKRNPEWITAAQESYIKGLWKLCSREKSAESLDAIVKRLTGTDSLAWLKKKDASKVILALREMAKKAGVNPDCKEA